MLTTGTSTELLKEQHERAAAAAKQNFQSKRNQPTEQEEDEYLNQLMAEINEMYAEFEQVNLISNRMAMQVAEYQFNNYVMSAWGPQVCCFHPKYLTELLHTTLDTALENFQTNRAESQTDDYKDKLVQRLEYRLMELQCINEYNNEQAVTAAFSVYTRRMDRHSSPSLSSLLVGPFIIKLLVALPDHHERARLNAIAVFQRRRRGNTYDDDIYSEKLKKLIEEAYENYRNPFIAIARELGLPLSI